MIIERSINLTKINTLKRRDDVYMCAHGTNFYCKQKEKLTFNVHIIVLHSNLQTYM